MKTQSEWFGLIEWVRVRAAKDTITFIIWFLKNCVLIVCYIRSEYIYCFYFLLRCIFVCLWNSVVIESDWSCQGQCEPRDNCLVHCFKRSYNYFSLHHVCCIVPLHFVALSPLLWNNSSSHHVTITNCTCPHQDRNANYYENVFLKLVVVFGV